MGVWLNDDETRIAAAVLELALRQARRSARLNGAAPAPALVALCAKIGALGLPAASRHETDNGTSEPFLRTGMDAQHPGPSPSSGPLPVRQAARMSRVSVRAVQAACASGRLAARKGPAGTWLISRRDLARWARQRAR